MKNYQMLNQIYDIPTGSYTMSFRKCQKFAETFNISVTFTIILSMLSFTIFNQEIFFEDIISFNFSFLFFYGVFFLLIFAAITIILSLIFRYLSYTRLRSYYFPRGILEYSNFENDSLLLLKWLPQYYQILNTLRICYLINGILIAGMLVLSFVGVGLFLLGAPVIEIIVCTYSFKWVNILEDHASDHHYLKTIIQNNLKPISTSSIKANAISQNWDSTPPRFCPFCGNELDDYITRFCPECGKNLEYIDSDI